MGMKAEDALLQAKAYTKKALEGAGALKGQDGKDGADGTSITVVSSEKVNGVSTTVLSDGTQIVVKDGTNGADGKDGIDGKDGADGSLGMVTVRTGGFAINENTQRIYANVSVPMTNSVISVGANGEYLCVSADGTYPEIFVSSSLEDPSWEAVTPAGVGVGILSVAYSKTHERYFLVANNGSIYYSEDSNLTSAWNSAMLNLSNADSIPLKVIIIDDSIYYLCDTGEVLYTPTDNLIVYSTNVIYEGATDITKVDTFFILQGSETVAAAIYDDIHQLDAKTLDDSTEVNPWKIVHWNGKLIGLDTNSDLFMAEARYCDELMNSNWVCISSISCQYSDGNNMYEDTKMDLVVVNDELYIIGMYGLYRFNKDLSITTMSDMRLDMNIQQYTTSALALEDGFLYKPSSNIVWLFTNEYEEIEATVAIQRMYSKYI